MKCNIWVKGHGDVVKETHNCVHVHYADENVFQPSLALQLAI